MKQARWAMLAASLGAALLGGCREDEQNRILSFEPGVYQGKKDTPLSAAALERLRERGRARLTEPQTGLLTLEAPQAAPAAAAAPAPAPAPAAAQSGPLGNRLQRQNF